MNADREFTIACPAPVEEDEVVTLAHGGGGRLMHALIERTIGPALGIDAGHLARDAALVAGGPRIALTTDSYVVFPRFFPGGDIGSLAVNGTVNDLAVAGAVPRYLSIGLIVEEGLAVAELVRVLRSMASAATRAGVELVTGDTKVVERGKGDGLFINTAGVGSVPPGVDIGPDRIRPGDQLLVSGDLGRHGAAIVLARDDLGFESEIASDCAPLHREVAALLEAGVDVRCLRDLTRGGLASAVVEIAGRAGLALDLAEDAIPVSGPVQSVCDLLGLDPLHMANEGRLVAVVSEAAAPAALAVLRRFNPDARRCGRAVPGPPGLVTLETPFGTSRVLDLPAGEPIPRIC